MILKILFAIFIIKTANAIELEINQGKLIGKVLTDRKGNNFYSFLSIPYAKPPINELRFKAPEEPEPWNGILNSTNDLPECPQIFGDKPIGTEDCLYLNVHTPQIGEEILNPVIVYIHGGGFIEGSGSTKFYGPENLIPEGVVLVTINYRLGLLGFINSEDPEINIPGNNGLKDQTMALKWVQKNIKKFGGNPNNVMIVGESAGGACAHLHMLSPLSKGLFHKVIAMSGNAGNQWSRGVPGTFEMKAKQLGIFDEDKIKMVKSFKDLKIEDILNVQKKYIVIPIHKTFENSVVVEKNYGGAFLPAEALDIIKTSNYIKVPFILAYNNKDGLLGEVLHRLYTGLPFIPKNFSETIPNDIDVNGVQRKELMNLIKQFYYGDEQPSDKNLDKTTQLGTGMWFIAGIVRVLNAMKDHFGDDTYLYRFSADTELNYFKKMTLQTAKVAGACHVDDLGYLFKTAVNPTITPGSDEEQAVDNMVKLLVTFLKTGKPTGDNDSLKWLPITKDVLNYMDIGVNLNTGVDPDKKDFDFWRNVYKKYDKKTSAKKFFTDPYNFKVFSTL